jgi:hypothetical protein
LDKGEVTQKMGIQGKTIVFTGKISRPRHEFQRLVEEHGGIAGLDVTKNTDYLVVGEKPGSKLIRANLLNIPTISEEEFLKLLQEEEEEHLSPTELEEINSHYVERTCSFCGKTYKVFDTVPEDDTCQFCSLSDVPKCPKCGFEKPDFITDFCLYHCTNCWTWFKAPFSYKARKVKHIHYWFRGTEEVKECFCGATLILKDGKWLKHEPASLIEECKKEAHELAVEEEREWAKKVEETKRVEQEFFKFLRSLSKEQLEQLRKQIDV